EMNQQRFTIRKDPSGPGYWTLASIIGERDSNLKQPPASIRNTLALLYSPDLRTWETRSILLHHPDAEKHGFQYVDWQFDGADIIAACRTAWEDRDGGARNNHDANFLTFHRWTDFRSRTDQLKTDAVTYRNFITVEKDGRVVSMEIQPDTTSPAWARDVAQNVSPWAGGPDPSQPYFEGPIPFVIKPDASGEPFFKHNHQPSVTWLDNGDLMAIWYTTGDEKGTELTVLASRLRAGKKDWDPAAAFFKSPDHNMHGSSLFRDGAGRLHHTNGMAPAGATGWDKLALLSRTSVDNGVTWTAPVAAAPEFLARQQVISGTLVARDGTIYQNCDASPGMSGGTALWVSHDHGQAWADAGAGKSARSFTKAGRGTIAGIHAGVVELANGRLLAFGRSNNINGRMPRSVSTDGGQTWAYSASPFPPIGGGQRLVLMRLREGPLLLVSFTSENRTHPRARGLEFQDGRGDTFTGYG
ncbi:MAG: exo-alpha-sialidase, partial [Verrucomicrobiaceae bacterium]